MSPPATLHIISGAGLSAESGVPTFREPGGLWDVYDMERVCNALSWKAYRDEVFAFYRACRLQAAQSQPCVAHHELARLQERFGPSRVRLLTQNVDDLLERAGAAQVVHLHGNLQQLQCTACGRFRVVSDDQYLSTTGCHHCKSVRGVKPAVVFFGEQAPQYVHLTRMRKQLPPQDIVVVVGSSMQVIGPDKFLGAARKGDDRNFQVNPAPVQTEWFGHNLAMGASAGLVELGPHLVALLEEGA